ncbi:hypothetical protein Dimus_020018 [Dionaea muscipula]
MSRRNNRQNPQLELKLNQSSSRETSPSSSCVSSEEGLKYSSSPEVTSMVLVGCPRCLMYVMLSGSESDPKCPKCKSTVLLDFLHSHDAATNNNKKNRNQKLKKEEEERDFK